MAGDERFSVVKRMLERAGYRLVRVHGSYHYFTKPGALPLSIPVYRGKVKAYYVRQVQEICQGD
jgi:predicted RNA binding protein YcfA (HicA-like mRNA interferase family)